MTISRATSMNAQNESFKAFTDAAADAVARAIASVQREAQREKELRDAEHRASMAEVNALLASVRAVERETADRLATLKNGEPGRDGFDGKDGLDGRDGQDGQSCSAEEVAGLLREHVETVASDLVRSIVDAWDRPKDGKDADPETLKAMLDEAVAALPVPKDGRDGKDGVDGRDGKDADQDAILKFITEQFASIPVPKDGIDGKDGVDGERGPEGPAGKLPTVEEWQDRVYYQGEVVTRDGGMFQAARDTGKDPSHDDWACIVRAGRDGADGKTPVFKGTWAEDGVYSALDIVARDGASFVATIDNPGSCPGAGWQLTAMRGKQGKPGERGAAGVGLRGLPGVPVKRLTVSEDGILTLHNADGSTAECDLYPLLTKIGG